VGTRHGARQVAVAALVEMRADDVARARVSRLALAGALRRVGGAATLSGPGHA